MTTERARARLLSTVETDTIRLALEMLRRARPDDELLLDAKEADPVEGILVDEAIAALIEELRSRSLIAIPIVTV
jgi:hypothetical protein